jgi:hypothetical protein
MLRGLTLPGTLSRVLDPFRSCFTVPTFETFTVLLAGLVAQSVCEVLTGAGLFRAGSRSHRRSYESGAAPRPARAVRPALGLSVVWLWP